MLTIPFVSIFWDSNLSEQIGDWGAFGSYFSIVISVANLVVFIYLTIYISQLDEEHHKSQIASQHKITLSQFRQTEITALSNRLNLLFENFGTESKSEILGNLTINSVYLNNFFNEKTYLFPILESREMKIRNKNFQSRCNQLISIVDEHYGTELPEEYQQKLATKIQFVFTMRNAIIEELQKFLLEDLKT
ncbi:hypothetical protein [Reichenbachiella sp. MALMAid0571]|uniref:hypothetical protein n=1 Tax=Reichenbachiella sp. MALMAid0571 TaxID=3143939 RepID=UPI0032E044DE